MRHRQDGLWVGESFGEFLRDRAARYATRTAVVDPSGERTGYAELDRWADAIGGELRESGIGPGTPVVVQLPNSAVYVAVLFGLWRVGAVPIFALPAHRESELVAFCTEANAGAIITTGRHGGVDYAGQAERVRARVGSVQHVIMADRLGRRRSSVAPVAPAVDAGRVAFLQLSGGTTGTPKLIPRTADDYLFSVRRSAEVCRINSETIYLCALPCGHNFPMSSPGILGVLHVGGTVVCAPSPDPATCFALIEREQVTMCALVPPLVLVWLEAAQARGGAPASLAMLQVGGARLSPEVARRVPRVLGCRLQQVFGMAEGLVCYTRHDDPSEWVETTQGRPMSRHDRVRIVDGGGRPVAEGQVGRLETQGPYTIRGYLNGADPDSFAPDGFYRSGDLVRRHSGGNLVVEGRVKDQINRGGEKIAPDEVENHLREHPDVHDAVLIALPDPRLGERTCAVVVPSVRSVSPTPALVRRFLRERGVAPFKLPDRIEVVAELPQTGVGKISRRALREHLARHYAPQRED